MASQSLGRGRIYCAKFCQGSIYDDARCCIGLFGGTIATPLQQANAILGSLRDNPKAAIGWQREGLLLGRNHGLGIRCHPKKEDRQELPPLRHGASALLEDRLPEKLI